MATNLQIDDRLIVKALKLGGHKTKKAAVTKALIEYIEHMQQSRIVTLFGEIDYDPTYNYKKQRAKS